MNNEDGYSDNLNDDNYCPFVVNFNANAVLHLFWMAAFAIMFYGVWTQPRPDAKEQSVVQHVPTQSTPEHTEMV